MASSIKIEHTITGDASFDRLSESIYSLISKMEGMGNNLGNASFVNPNQQELNLGAGENTNKGAGLGMENDPMRSLASAIDKSVGKTGDLIARIELLTTQFKNLNEGISKAQSNNLGGGNDNPDNSVRPARQTNFKRALLGYAIGTGVALSYEAGSFGQTAGSAGGALNAGILNYTDFETQYANRQISNRQSLTSTGLSMLPALGYLMNGSPTAKIATTAVLAGVGAVGNYFAGEHFQGEKEANEQKRQDLISWRLTNMGMSGMSNDTILGNIRLTNAQKGSLSSAYAPYDANLSDVLFAGKRDVMSRMSVPEKLEFNKNLTLASQLSGSSTGQLSSLATMMTSMTGMSANDSAKKLQEDATRYGGDTAANTGKMLEILKNSAVSPQEAHDLAFKYQANQPMLENKLANANAPQSAQFMQEIYMKLGGTSQAEIDSGTWSAAHRAKAMQLQRQRNHAAAMTNPFYIGYTKSFEAIGANPWASESASVLPSGQLGNLAPTQMQSEDFASKVADSLKNIKEVHTTGHVYVYGNERENAAKSTSQGFTDMKSNLMHAGTGLFVGHHRK